MLRTLTFKIVTFGLFRMNLNDRKPNLTYNRYIFNGLTDY